MFEIAGEDQQRRKRPEDVQKLAVALMSRDS
jgi:hypothetical protein